MYAHILSYIKPLPLFFVSRPSNLDYRVKIFSLCASTHLDESSVSFGIKHLQFDSSIAGWQYSEFRLL